MPRDDRTRVEERRTHVEEWAGLVGETVSEEATLARDRRDRWVGRD